MENIRIFNLKIFSFLMVEFSIYLNMRVFVMIRDPEQTVRSLRTSERRPGETFVIAFTSF